MSIAKDKDPSNRVKMHQTFFYFYHYLSYICWVDLIYLTCLVFILCSNPLNLKNEITKIEHKIFCGKSKILKNISWPINMSKIFYDPHIYSPPPPSYILNVRSPIGRKRLGQSFWILIWLYCYLLIKIRLDLGLYNSC